MRPSTRQEILHGRRQEIGDLDVQAVCVVVDQLMLDNADSFGDIFRAGAVFRCRQLPDGGLPGVAGLSGIAAPFSRTCRMRARAHHLRLQDSRYTISVTRIP